MISLIDRARGALLGMAVGEAMGSPLDGLTPEVIEQKASRIKGFLNPVHTQPAARVGEFFRAVYEDETQAALAVTEALVRRNGFDIEMFKSQLEELGRPIAGNPFGMARPTAISKPYCWPICKA
jgi:ADP-ribosylglycohydrolase